MLGASRSRAGAYDLLERPTAQLFEVKAGKLVRLISGNGSALDGSKKCIEQPLAGRRIVEDRSKKLGLGCFFDQAFEAMRVGVEGAEEEGINRAVARRQLIGVQIPALVDAARKCVLDVSAGPRPSAMHRGAIRLALVDRQMLGRPSVRANRH